MTATEIKELPAFKPHTNRELGRQHWRTALVLREQSGDCFDIAILDAYQSAFQLFLLYVIRRNGFRGDSSVLRDLPVLTLSRLASWDFPERLQGCFTDLFFVVEASRSEPADIPAFAAALRRFDPDTLDEFDCLLYKLYTVCSVKLPEEV